MLVYGVDLETPANVKKKPKKSDRAVDMIAARDIVKTNRVSATHTAVLMCVTDGGKRYDGTTTCAARGFGAKRRARMSPTAISSPVDIEGPPQLQLMTDI